MIFSSIFLLSLLPGQLLGFIPNSRQRKSSSKLSSSPTIDLPEGILKTVYKEGNGPQVKRGDVATVKYSCYMPDSPPFARAESQRVTIGSGEMIEGWEKAIQTMRIGERAVVQITDPSFAYGIDGVPPVVPPNAEVELVLEVLDARARKDIDFDALAIGDPSTPRTAESISAAYDQLMEKRALEPKKEGLQGFITTLKGWYFFGFFEGETGEEAPWYLKPMITFPLAFAIVGAAFYVSLVGGAITERGLQRTDELDEIILSLRTTPPNALLLTALSAFTEIANSFEL